MTDETRSQALTHHVVRVSAGPPVRIFFNALGRSLEWQPADDPDQPGSPQDVPAVVAEVITADPALAPHFRCDPIAPPAAVSAGPAPEGRPRGVRTPAE